jgi:hypothetical protein
MLFDHLGFLLIELREVIARAALSMQQLIKLSVNSLRIAMFRTLY